MKLAINDQANNYIELSQSSPIRFAFGEVDKNMSVTNRHPFIKCTDFFVDAIFGSFKGETKSIYGWSWDHKKPLYDTDGIMVLKVPPNINLNILNSFEKEAGIPLTKILLQDENYTVVEYHRDYNKAPLLIHIFCYLLRLGTYEKLWKVPSFSSIEENLPHGTLIPDLAFYSSIVQELILSTLKNRHKIFLTKEDKKIKFNIGQIHNNSGIRSWYSLNKAQGLYGGASEITLTAYKRFTE